MLEYKKQFKKLAPQWYEELKTPLKCGQKPKNPRLNIKGYKCCIVGEIHEFSSYYGDIFDDTYCYDCHVLSAKLCYESTLKRNIPLIIKLMSHINESHPELMEGKKC